MISICFESFSPAIRRIREISRGKFLKGREGKSIAATDRPLR